MNEKNEKRQLAIFSVIAFGLPVIMGLLMWYGYSHDKDLNLFTITHMYYPAAGSMIALLVSKRRTQLIPKTFFMCYLFQTAVMIGFSLISLFVNNPSLYRIAVYFSMFGGLLSLIFLITTKKQQRTAYGLSHKNWKATIGMVLLYLLLYIVRTLVAYLAEGSLAPLAKTFSDSMTWIALFSILISAPLTFVPFFGEEYGWRYFLQPILQKNYGSLKGVLLLGIVWGLWHLPINFFFYTSPSVGIISVTNQIVVCIAYGIFYAYAYMKTDNIWTVVALHFLNNNLIPVFSGDLSGESMSGYSITWSQVGAMAILMTLFYAWPALTKFFRDRSKLNPTPEQRADRVAYALEVELKQKTAGLG
ncbi:type II CAAX endopeptidase family protein [Enterococcus sp.]|uniref:CPBP family intramembrane glutamic endopeptidase n=1 Tax=Enterococcus sp. TaxID=35783 RepID=UPI00290E9C8F|nr:type II CAAX endopeptidase family protein [Enterococcus sp.]MDU5336601.1 type II CAAX endopeptidase family protein [Enterococcus sp.]